MKAPGQKLPYAEALDLARDRFPGSVPFRAHGVLYPLIRVEANLVVGHAKDLGGLESFLLRALHEAGAATLGEIAELLGLEHRWAGKALLEMAAAGTVCCEGDLVSVTNLGIEFLRNGNRIEKQVERRAILFDAICVQPLPAACYGEHADSWVFAEGDERLSRFRYFRHETAPSLLTCGSILREAIFRAVRACEGRWSEVHLPPHTLGIGEGILDISAAYYPLLCVSMADPDEEGALFVFNPVTRSEDDYFTAMLERLPWARRDAGLDSTDGPLVVDQVRWMGMECESAWLSPRIDGNFTYAPPARIVLSQDTRRILYYLSGRGKSPIALDHKGRLLFPSDDAIRSCAPGPKPAAPGGSGRPPSSPPASSP